MRPDNGGVYCRRLAVSFLVTLEYAIMKLSRAQIKEGIEQIPMSTILGVSSKALTPKQKQFCKESALGASGSEAYRRAYKSKGNTRTVAVKASNLKAQDNIKATILAMEAAIEAQTYQTPAALRALVIQTLVQTMIDPEAKDSVKVQAAKTLGTVTEVAAFTERKEVRTITSSEDTKAKLMLRLRDMMKAEASDAPVIEVDSLLEELRPKTLVSDTHPSPTPTYVEQESHSQLHTTPHKQSQNSVGQSPELLDPEDPTPSIQEDPPVEDPK
jgi:hypothetical protein